MSWLLVFVGGGLGSVARYALSRALVGVQGPGGTGALPWATLLANVLACVVMGVFLWAFVDRTTSDVRLFVLTGFCGGFSTFSTFSLDTLALFREGYPVLGALNVVLNMALCIVVLALLTRRA